jgi:hypothetical protein
LIGSQYGSEAQKYLKRLSIYLQCVDHAWIFYVNAMQFWARRQEIVMFHGLPPERCHHRGGSTAFCGSSEKQKFPDGIYNNRGHGVAVGGLSHPGTQLALRHF